MTTPVKSNQQHIFIHDSLTEGPIQGLLYGTSSVFLNGNRLVPLTSDSAFDPVKATATVSGTDLEITSSDLIPSGMIGTPKNTNYVSLRSAGATKTSTGTISGDDNSFTITVDVANFFDDSFWTTAEASLRVVALYNPLTESIIALGEGSDGTNNQITFTLLDTSTSKNINILRARSFEVALIELIPIASIDSATEVTLTSSPSAGNGTYTIRLTGAETSPNVEDEEAENPTPEFKVQFRNGYGIQSPINELNGVGGGVSWTGNPTTDVGGGGPTLRQIDYSTPSLDSSITDLVYNAGTGKGYKTDQYPDEETYAQASNSLPSTISAQAFCGGVASNIPLLDEIRISIAYSSFIAINTENGNEQENGAVYLFQIRKKTKVGDSFGSWRHAFRAEDIDPNGNSIPIGQVPHKGKNKSAVSFEHYIDLNFIKPFVDFEVRITRLTRHKGGAIKPGSTSYAVGGANMDGISDDGDPIVTQGDATSSISNITGINKDRFYYPYTAHAGVFLDSREFTNLPKRSYEVRGLKVKIPTAYTPREYSGATQTKGGADYPVPTYAQFWDGDMTEDEFYTDNPAWIFYDIVTNDRFGAGEWIEPSDIDVYSLYKISKYCDELVEDGKGGYEPRFRANIFLTKATDAYKVLKDMATVFTSMVYWMDGKMTTVLDAPSDPIYNFSRANVIEGNFTYETTGNKTRANQVVVSWNNPDAGYELTTLIVEDKESIIQLGRIIKEEAVAFGCTSEGQAKRYAKWKLFTAKNQTEIVSFQAALDGAFIRPGDVINIQDSARYGAKYSGRIAAITDNGVNSVLTLDRDLNLESGSYQISVLITEPMAFYIGKDDIQIDGTTYSRGDKILQAYVDTNETVDNPEGGRTLKTINSKIRASNAWTAATGGEIIPLEFKEESYVETKSFTLSNGNTITTNSFTTLPKKNTVYVIQETDGGSPTVGSAKPYKVLGVAQNSKNIYDISAVEYYSEKYDIVDDPNSTLDIPENVFPPEEENITDPTSLFILQNSDASRPDEELQLQWEYPAIDSNGLETGRFLDSFEIYNNIPGQEDRILTGKRARSYSFTNVPNGTYTFRVRSISVSGKLSNWVTARYVVDDPFSDNVNRIKGLQTEGLTTHFPYITNQTGILGAIRGAYDTTGSVTYSTNDVVTDGGQSYYLSGSDTNVGHVSVLADNTATAGTWTEYSAGILKFNDSGENVVLAPSKFKSNDTVSLSTGYTLDCNVMNSLGVDFPGIPGGNPRAAYVVLDHDSSALKLIKADFDSALNLFYWQDLNVYDPADTNAVWSALTGTATVAAGSNKVVGTGTTFTSLNNLNKLKFSTSGTAISFSGITWSNDIATVSATGHGLNAGDIINISGVSPEGYNAYTVTVSTADTNSFTYPIATNPGTYASGGTITPYTFYEGARVAYVESDTVLYLNRKLDQDTQFSGTVRVQEYAPDFRRDVIIGQVFYNTTFGGYTFKNFLTLDPNLTAARSVFLDSNVSYAQFDLSNNPILLPDNIIVDATAVGFENPEFKITYGGTGDEEFTGEDEDFSTASPNPFKYEKTIYTNTGSNDLSYDAGAAYEITVTVREANDPGNTDKQRTDTFDIVKVDNVAAGSGAKIVTLELEDYSIVYDADGENPAFNTTIGTDPTITATATASPGFANPIFRFTIDGNQGSWVSSASNISTATYTVPTNISSWGSGTGGTRVFIVEVAEEPTNFPTVQPVAGDIEASDSASLLAVQIGQGGLAVSLSNPTHSLTADDTGVVSSNTGSGTTIEVFVGGVGIDYVSSGPSLGEWTISTITDTGGADITPGTPTTSGTNPVVANVPDHTFSSVNALDDQEAITYTITVPQGANKSDLTATAIQTFSLAKGAAASTTASLVFLYAASSSQPADIGTGFPDVTVDLSTGLISGYTNPSTDTAAVTDWYDSANGAAAGASSTDKIWVVAATGNGTGSTDTIAFGEWSSPVQFTGVDGFNTATIELYQLDTSDSSAPADPTQGLTYTFNPPSLSSQGINGWSQSRPEPSRAFPYVWRISAAAVSNTSTDTIDTNDWSSGIVVDRFIEDGITLELTNDAETVGATTISTALSGLSLATTAKVFQAGTDITSQWDFSEVADTGITVSQATNTFTVTDLTGAFTSGNVTITAAPKSGGDYVGAASRSVNFTVTKVANGADGVSYRINPTSAVVSYDSNNPAWTPTSVTFSATKVTPTGSSAFTAGYWKLNGANQGQASSIGTGTISSTSGNITAQLYLDSGYTQLVDTESVPIVPSGTDGAASTVPGDDGTTAFQFVLYWNTGILASGGTPPSNPNIDFYDFGTGALESGGTAISSNWVSIPPQFNPVDGSGNAQVWYAITVSAKEGLDNNGNRTGDTSGTGGSASNSSPAIIQSFTGIVTFQNLAGTGTTTINGSNISTGKIVSQSPNSPSATDLSNNGTTFTSQGTIIDLATGNIATPDFHTGGATAGFKGELTVQGNSNVTGELTVGTGTGSITISGSGQTIIINDGTANRVILGKLS